MDRREFLITAARTLVVLPMGTFLVEACGSSDNNSGTTTVQNPTQPDTTPPDAPPQVQGNSVVYTSNRVNDHSHSFTIASADIVSPPANGVSGQTTLAQLHVHDLTVTQADLQAAANGQTVKVETSSVLGHTHFFTIVKVA